MRFARFHYIIFIDFIRKPRLLMVYSGLSIIVFHLISSLVHSKDIDYFIRQFGVSTANDIWVRKKLSSIIIWGWGQSKIRTTNAHRLFLVIIKIFYWCLRPKINFSNHKNLASMCMLYSLSCLNKLDFITNLIKSETPNWLTLFAMLNHG